MPKKKGKKKSKKASKKSEGEVLELDGDGAQLGIGKKKKAKKVKLTKEEKAAAKLAKKLEAFLCNDNDYGKFLNKIDKWMIENKKRVETLFKNFDQEEEGIVPFDVFRAGLHDLLCPLTDLEINALARTLDPEDTGLIEYCGFEHGIHNRTFPEDEGDGDDVKDEDDNKLTPEDFVPEIVTTGAGGKKAVRDPLHANYSRFVEFNMRLATFDHVTSHPAHFQVTVHTHMTVATLQKLIGEVGHVTTGKMNIFADKDCHQESCLPPSCTLQEWYKGGPQHNPQRVTLYYDYVIEYSDCPLLNCDHYFGQEKRPMNPVLTAYPPRQRAKS
uniref:Uncharacterized protein LOC100176286 n=1 Tax=Phallusia mammillata TaxID=59560 RepID=A0A6F9DH36_9ASCI|nr:uncharacterized protein LOC100176286 [Phallusia mammillata]